MRFTGKRFIGKRLEKRAENSLLSFLSALGNLPRI
jgi:hypothetical protein